MRRPFLSIVAALSAVGLLLAACSSASPPAPTSAPAPAPTKAPAAAPSAPTAAPALVAPTSAPTAVPAPPKVTFPEKGKPITLVVPYTAGGATDVAGRLLAAMMEKDLGTSIQVVNKASPATQQGLTDLATAKPDGYTLAATSLPAALTVYLDPERKAVFKRESFQPVANQFLTPVVVAVQPDSPYKDMKDLVDAAKAKPGQVKMASSGILGVNHLAALALERLTGAKFGIVQFQGGGPAVTALLGGHVDFAFAAPPEVLPQLKSGQLRIIGTMEKQENKKLPGVKTLEAQGYKIYFGAYIGIALPAGTPKDVVDVLSATARKAILSDEHKSKLDEMGYTVLYMDPAEYAKFWAEFEQEVVPLVELAKKQ